MRLFQLNLGAVFDIEKANSNLGIGAIYKKISAYEFNLLQVKHVVLQPLVAGGMDYVEAETLVTQRMELGLADVQVLALDLLVAFFEGDQSTEDEGEKASDEDLAKPHDRGAILEGFIKAGVPPGQVRAISYSDYLELTKKIAGKSLKPPSEKEFEEMLKAYEAQTYDD